MKQAQTVHHQMAEHPAAAAVLLQPAQAKMVVREQIRFQHGHRQHQQVIQVITQVVVVLVEMETTEQHLLELVELVAAAQAAAATIQAFQD